MFLQRSDTGFLCWTVNPLYTNFCNF